MPSNPYHPSSPHSHSSRDNNREVLVFVCREDLAIFAVRDFWCTSPALRKLRVPSWSPERTMLELFSRIRRMRFRFLPTAFRREHSPSVTQFSAPLRNPLSLLTASGHMKEVSVWTGSFLSLGEGVATRRNIIR